MVCESSVSCDSCEIFSCEPSTEDKQFFTTKASRKMPHTANKHKNDKKHKEGFAVVEDKDANVNLLGSRAAQQMNLIQDNDENILSRASEVHVVQTPSEFALTEEQIRTKFADLF